MTVSTNITYTQYDCGATDMVFHFAFATKCSYIPVCIQSHSWTMLLGVFGTGEVAICTSWAFLLYST